MNIDELPPVKSFVSRYNLGARKALGQNFLFDLNLASRIVRSFGSLEGETVLEIGPGFGSLTRAILALNPAKVIVVERDPRFFPVLCEIAAHYPGKLHIVIGDALMQDYQSLITRPARIIASLPYNIATALLITWLSDKVWPSWWSSATLVFQREVAERIVAASGSRAYGRLSILVGWLADSAILFGLSPKVFVPVPKVSSTVVRLIPRQEPFPCDKRILEKVTAAAFGKRRKMLRSSLKSLVKEFNCSEQSIECLLEQSGIDGTLRAEDVDVIGFLRLANAFSAYA